jgi:integrase/recombinase XerD
MLLSTAFEGYWLARQRNLSPHTVRDYQLTFRRFQEHLGADRELAAITSDDVQRFLNHLRDDGQHSPKTVLNYWIGLSSFWTWAEKELGIPHLVRLHIEQPRVHRKPVQPYTKTEVQLLIGACQESATYQTPNGHRAHGQRPTALRDRAIMLVLLDSGLRASELCALTLADYERKRGQLTIRHGKGDKTRIVYIGDAARQAVWRYLATRKNTQPADPLFTTRENIALDRGALRRMIASAGQRAGVENAGAHRFRHTFAINFLRNGGNLLALQELLGHEQMETVKLYAKLAEVDLEYQQRVASPADRWRL